MFNLKKKNYTPEWTMDDQNTLRFTIGEKLHRKRFAPLTMFDRPIVSVLLMFGCLLIDIALFYQLLSVIGVDSWYVTLLSILGFAIGYDVGPVYIGSQLKKMKQGLDTNTLNKFLIVVLAVAFIMSIGVNIFMRITFRAKSLPLTPDIKEIYTLASWAFAVFCIIVPIITSCVSFCVSFFNTDPLKEMLKNAEDREMCLKDRIREINGTLEEDIPDEEYRKNLVNDDEKLCLNKIDMVDEKTLEYCYYVRKRLKEHLGDPADISELSKDIRSTIMDRLYPKKAEKKTINKAKDQIVFSEIA